MLLKRYDYTLVKFLHRMMFLSWSKINYFLIDFLYSLNLLPVIQLYQYFYKYSHFWDIFEIVKCLYTFLKKKWINAPYTGCELSGKKLKSLFYLFLLISLNYFSIEETFSRIIFELLTYWYIVEKVWLHSCEIFTQDDVSKLV